MQIEETAIDIRQIDYNKLEVLDSDYGWATLDVDWSVGGVVTHQGHQHTRINRYRALYNLNNINDDGWRITDVKMRNAERIRRASDSDLLDGAEAGGGYLDALDLLDAGMGNVEPYEGNVQTPEYTPGDTGLEPVRKMKFEGFE